MPIAADVQQLDPGDRVELYEVDLTHLGGDVLRYHAHLQSGPIRWGGNDYQPWPISASGFARSGGQAQPSPTLVLSNVDGSLSALCVAFEDMVGARVKRLWTLARYLDGQPDANPEEVTAVELWKIEQRTEETPVSVTFKLSSALDFTGVQLPARQVQAPLCNFDYRDPAMGCSWQGVMFFDKHDNPVDDPALDVCSKRLSGCKCRFGEHAILPWGGFPSAGRNGIG
ncbi:phage minor tail protein L [Burkholderia pseudomallei]|uniref:phage minor tail protein L n=1 Tax=Burkholderia pseudomallei TaxID=28450 RepID=UPI00016ABA7D|nr:phage minor tail protein L [Burkholderia pseudomallei]MBF3629518.1 phage minor tail protein L [Burkholderia pseudomallei]MBF3641432.1 phage minor tail protein L [Burkholderia pseudomallei]MBF3955138.1 phage minor tail protein L [Burkholderia pseudomallei]MWA23153.1 phage minor tail protein L [Burkholderia pseudomallei]MXP94612.1 phage minor tail protein L [Burkholderia pseudomallei]